MPQRLSHSKRSLRDIYNVRIRDNDLALVIFHAIQSIPEEWAVVIEKRVKRALREKKRALVN